MNRRLDTRLARLEQHVGASPDLATEAERYGSPLWSTAGTRAYGQDGPAGARLVVVGPHGAVAYEVPGVSLAELL
ncbi:hypothetical protein ACF09I_35645 [Streptomyces sp. NPDC014940]|uniref:hypothetical protein n=1 Tax=Streptomyces sp. NPDC014940 TaxID=3364932 RepID=UPI0037005962